MVIPHKKGKVRLGERKRRRISAWIVISVCGGVLFCTSVIFFLRSSFFALDTIVITGVQKSDIPRYEKVIEPLLTESLWWIFPRKNKLFYSKQEIISILLAYDSKIKSVVISSNGNTLSLALVLREPGGVWCGEHFSGGQRNECYSIDREGILFEKTNSSLVSTYIAYYGILPADTKTVIGTHFKDTEYFKKLSLWQPMLLSRGFSGMNVVIHEGDTCELRLTKPVSGYVLFNCANDSNDYQKYLESFLEKEPAEQLLADPARVFRYLDLRFGRRIFLKRGGETAVPFEIKKEEEVEE